MLKVNNIDTNYGVVAMLRDVSFEVAEGEFVCVLGPNGAGKTTTFRALSGLLPLARGRIELMGRDLAGLRTERLSALGIGFVPEGRLFAEISVRDNIRLGFEAQKAEGAFSDRLEEMLNLFPRVRDRINQRAGTLSGGEQTMVALARALIGSPSRHHGRAVARIVAEADRRIFRHGGRDQPTRARAAYRTERRGRALHRASRRHTGEGASCRFGKGF